MSLLASQSPTYFTNIPCGDGNNNGWGGNFGEWILVFLLASMFGWGGFGGGFGMGGGCGMMWPWMMMNGFGGCGNCGGGNCATQADVRAAVDQQTLISKIDQQTYGLADVYNGLSRDINNNFRNVDNAICDLGYRNQQGINDISRQIGDCCCSTGRAIDGVRYDMGMQACETRHQASDNTRDIIDANNSGVRAILEKLGQIEYNNLNDKYQAVVAENQSLKQNAYFAANQEAQTATLLRRLGAECPQPAYMVQPPTPINFPVDGCGNVQFGWGGGCGCRRSA